MNIFKKKLITFVGMTLGTAVLAPTALAQDIVSPSLRERIQTRTGLGTAEPREVTASLIGVFLGFLGIIAVIIIIYAGFRWMTAAGNEEQISSAKRTLVAAVIGLILILSSLGIAIFLFGSIERATGFN